MKDFLGKEIAEGDLVVFSSFDGSDLGKGVVIKICEKMVRVSPIIGDKVGPWNILRDPLYCVVAGSNFMGYPEPNKD